MCKRITKFYVVALCLFCVLCCSGCFTRTVYVPDGKAVRLRQEITAKVWVLDKDLKPIPGKITLQEGWWVLPDPVPVTEPSVDEPSPSETIIPKTESEIPNV